MARFGDAIGHYELSPIPGNQFVCISHRAFVRPAYRGQGYGQAKHRERLDKARELGYTYIMATVRNDNAVEEHILIKNGWLRLHDNVSVSEDGVNVSLWGKGLA